MSHSNDPLFLAELDPVNIQKQIDARDKKNAKLPTELELQKEARLAQKESRLAGGTSAKTPKATEKVAPEAPPTAPAPPKVDRSAMLDKIAAYRERFPNLKKRNTINGKSSNEELEDELHFIELQLGSSGGNFNIGATVLYGAMVGLETLTTQHWNPLGLNLTGLGAVTQQNMPEFQPLVDELMIKYGAGSYTSPEWRLALMIGATVMTVNSANNNPDMARAVKTMSMQVKPPKGSNDL